MSAIEYGSKYSKTLSTTDIAKRIRADVKAAILDGSIPDMAVSVRKTHHNSLHIELSAVPFEVLCEERVLADHDAPHKFHGNMNWMSDEGMRVVKAVEKIANAYNFDGSDIQSDYFNVNFYLSVVFSYEMTDIEKEMILVRNNRRAA